MPNLSYIEISSGKSFIESISKRNYYNNYFLKTLITVKKIWKGVKQIVIFKPRNTN